MREPFRLLAIITKCAVVNSRVKTRFFVIDAFPCSASLSPTILALLVLIMIDLCTFTRP